MAIVSDYFAIGKNVYNPGTGITMYIGGQDFNPREPTGLFLKKGSNLITATTAPDTNLSTYQTGHEVMVGVSRISNTGPSDVTVKPSIRFKDPYGTTVLWIAPSGSFTLPVGGYFGIYVYIGIDYDEIVFDGTYTIEQYWEDATMLTSTTITFSNVPSFTSRNSGMIWVEGDNLHFTDATLSSTLGYEHVIKNDGGSYGSSAGNSGKFWVDTGYNGKLSFVDASDVIRRTYLADDGAGVNIGGGTELPLSGKTAGMIWVSDNSGGTGSYGYMTFIGNDGKGYRIMNGSV